MSSILLGVNSPTARRSPPSATSFGPGSSSRTPSRPTPPTAPTWSST
ncbi:hypothetical protein ACR6C2_01870 [Streptomyces sp. INA 01156]